jgi:hypothetical protein
MGLVRDNVRPFSPNGVTNFSWGRGEGCILVYPRCPFELTSLGVATKRKMTTIFAAGQPLGCTCSVFPDLLEPDTGNLEGQRHGTPDRLDANAKLSSHESHVINM